MRLADRILVPVEPQLSVAMSITSWLKALTKPKKTNLRFTLPDVTSVFGLLFATGLPVGVAIQWLAPRCAGEIGALLQRASDNLELGADLIAELDALSGYGDPGLSELSEKFKLMIERGAGVSPQVFELAGSMKAELYRELMAKAGSNETKMLIPTVFLILPVTVLFALFPSLTLLQQSL